MGLRYTGRGFLPGFPARDLTDEEVEQWGGRDALTATGAYEEKADPKSGRDKKITGPTENKDGREDGETWQA